MVDELPEQVGVGLFSVASSASCSWRLTDLMVADCSSSSIFEHTSPGNALFHEARAYLSSSSLVKLRSEVARWLSSSEDEESSSDSSSLKSEEKAFFLSALLFAMARIKSLSERVRAKERPLLMIPPFETR